MILLENCSLFCRKLCINIFYELRFNRLIMYDTFDLQGKQILCHAHLL